MVRFCLAIVAVLVVWRSPPFTHDCVFFHHLGRAGRRGKDDRGLVIQMLDEKMEPAVCKGILYGDPDPLNSSYRISYNMLLNLMRVEDVEPEFLFARFLSSIPKGN